MVVDKLSTGDLALASPEPETMEPNESQTPPIMNAQASEPNDFDFQVDDTEVNYDEDAYEVNNEELGLADDRFTIAKPIYNEIPYAIIFLIVFFIFTVISIKNIVKHLGEFERQTPWISGPSGDIHFSYGLIMLLLFVTLISSIVAGGIFILVDRHCHKVVRLSFTMMTYGSIILGIFALFINFGLGASLLVFGSVGFIILKRFNPSIELASIVLSEAFKVLKKYPSTALFSFVSLVVLLLVEGIFYVVIGTTFIDFGFKADGSHVIDGDGNDTSKASFKLIFTIMFLSFSKFYISDVLRNVIHTTVAGVYGSWYYMQSTFDGMPVNEGIGSLRRACTFSFGSICCGSLFVVLFQLIATMIQVVHFERVGIIGEVFIALFTFVAILVGYFNLYVYSYVGIYGKGIMESLKTVVQFFRQRGRHASRKDAVIVLSMNCLSSIAAIIGCALTGIYLYIFGSLFKIDSVAIGGIIIYAYILTFQICNVIMMTALSGSVSFFLALNKDPAVFQESDPFQFQEFGRCYPPVLDKLHLDAQN